MHALLVPLRDEDGQRARRACGSRTAARSSGSTGVDNGRIWFDDVRVPRQALLDRYGQVDEDGKYRIADRERRTGRFFTTIGTLIQGRV